MTSKIFILSASALFSLSVYSQTSIIDILKLKQYDLSNKGRDFILNESHRTSFILLGELHGEKEIPDLIYLLWPELKKNGFNHIAAEISPWAAQKLEFGIGKDSLKIEALWSNKEAKFIHTNKATISNPTIWGCDMEEISLNEEISLLTQINNRDSIIKKISFIAGDDYSRQKASSILKALANHRPQKDSLFNNISLFENIKSSLIIDSLRAYPGTKLTAQIMRESLIKEYFLKRYNNLSAKEEKGVFFRFGRNHLHKGFDDRGISTLGNFVAEFAFAKGLKCFNIAAFAAGGQYALLGDTYDADETNDDTSLEFLSKQAYYNATIFDLRPLRIELHKISLDQRNELNKRLLFWADSYDAIICYGKVTPFNH